MTNDFVRNLRILTAAVLAVIAFAGFADAAYAQLAPPPPPLVTDNNFSSIAFNITDSIEFLPGLLTGLSYLFALLMGAKGILRLKDHVENPKQMPLKDATVMLLAGGALFALPIIYEAMFMTVGETGAVVEAASVASVRFNVLE